MTTNSTKYPLSAPTSAGLDNLLRLGLNTETSMKDNIEEAHKFSEVLISAHAPAIIDGVRLNYAATDEEFRGTSIEHIKGFIDQARRYPKVKQVNVHPSPRRWNDDSQTSGREGDYGLQIDGLREIAAFAAGHGIEIVLENINAYWAGVADDVPPEQVDWSERNAAFGASPEEWVQIRQDVSRQNVWLCLDSSHIVTYAHTFPPERRQERVMAFLSRPELIKHVHWNDNYLFDPRGRVDSHALLGKGTLPIELHQAIKTLDATLLLEHFYSIEELEEELEFIDAL